MKKILITTVLFLMMLSVPVMAGTYSRSSKSNSTCIVSGCSRSRCDKCFYCSGHKCAESNCKNKRASDSMYCSKHKSKTNNNRKSSSYRSSSSSKFIEALNALEESNSTKDRRLGTAIRSCLRRGIITVQDYTDDGKWNEEMKLAEQMGFVRRITEDRCLIMQDVKPCFDLLDSGQKRRARRLFDSFGEDAFSLELVVATMDYSSSTASAYLHQFTLLRILECRKKMYQFLVNPKEHPEVFEDIA